MSEKDMCRQAGVKFATVRRWREKCEPFKRALAIEHRRAQVVANMSRKTVINGLLEAKDMARDMMLPGGMISAWKEIGRMCGFYEPERREIFVSVDNSEAIQQIRQMTREQLLEHLSAPPASKQLPTLEAEYTEVENDG